MNDIMKLASGPVMWTISLVTIGIAILESVLIYQRAKKFVVKTNLLTSGEMKMCMKTGGIVAIGPATSAFVVSLSMISMLGAPITLMRVGMIGAPATELMSAGIGTEAAGVVLGTDALTGPALAAALWSCAILSSGYLILVPIMTRGLGVTLGKAMSPKEDGKKSIWVIIFGAILPLVVFGALAVSQVTKSVIHAATFGSAAVVMLGLNKIAKKNNTGWLKQWAMGIAVLCAMIVGGIMKNI
ncbi:MAG: DUF5058 family protein [Dorea sp.]|jgi:hypothetical protein|nr:DUF5058 family protein [Dorea sp.]MCI9452918.1 DUF5058 family protein [Dorea sp.]